MSAAARTIALVVPCCNEEQRLGVADIDLLADDKRVRLVLVDDGSTDGTLALLRGIAARRTDVTVVALAGNVGKGEAVRAGLLAARALDPVWVGYVDADFSTPAVEMLRLIGIAEATPACNVVLGARVAMLGRRITRSAFRHYTGRVFATLASNVLGEAVYDTQCGAKLFRVGPVLDRSLAVPFRSRWAFDVELLGRLARGGFGSDTFREEPLEVWHDVQRSKRSVLSSLRATAALWPIWRDLREQP